MRVRPIPVNWPAALTLTPCSSMPHFVLSSNHNFPDSLVHKVVVEEDLEANIQEGEVPD